MGGVRVQGKVPRQSVSLGNRYQVAPDVPMAIAVKPGIAEGPVQKAGTVQAEGPVGAACAAPR